MLAAVARARNAQDPNLRLTKAVLLAPRTLNARFVSMFLSLVCFGFDLQLWQQ
jgi:hypothetical protein